MSERFEYTGGTLRLRRYPHRPNTPLQAWDAADQYLLNTLADAAINHVHPLIISDGFGALALALKERHPTLVSDSHLTHRGVRENQALNPETSQPISILSPLSDWPHNPGVVLIKIPKQLAYLEFILQRLRPLVGPDTPIFAGGMVKHLSRNTRAILEKNLGSATPSRAWKKARIYRVRKDPSLAEPSSRHRASYQIENPTVTLADYPNVFSRGKLDGGTRLLLKHLPGCEGVCIDLGCGNGLLGIAMALRSQTALVRFVDVSHLALASAEANWRENGLPQDRAEFLPNNGLDHMSENSAELILCNPPFHQGQAVSDDTAWHMLNQSAKVLKPGGHLWVVGNRHLGYHRQLKRIFGGYTHIEADRRFVVLRSQKKA